MRIAITGATGYIGQRLVRAALEAGHEVLALSREPVRRAGLTWQAFELADTAPLSLPEDTGAVFHLAAETQQATGAGEIELAAARRLIDAASAVRAGFVFVSSQAAQADAPTAYGRIKWQIELLTLAAGGHVVRPGLVYGGPEQGLFGRLCALVRRQPLLPAFVPAPLVQPVHIDDLVKALLTCLTQAPSSVHCVAAPEGVSFTRFLQVLAVERTGRRLIGVPVPTVLVRIASRLLGPALSSKLGLDRLRSLFALPRRETTIDLQNLGLTLRPLRDGMTRSGCGRRSLLIEGRALLAYVLRMAPANSLVRRYVRAIETLRNGRSLHLPGPIRRAPALLALLDRAPCLNTEFRNELDWRLNAALILGEASPQGAVRFLGLNSRSGRLRSVVKMTLAVAREALRRVGQLLLWPILARVGRRRTAQ
jgi:nucleoside-diphosphate-sugar epimerase